MLSDIETSGDAEIVTYDVPHLAVLRPANQKSRCVFLSRP